MGAGSFRLTYLHGYWTWLWSIRVVLQELMFNCLIIWVILFTVLLLLFSLLLTSMARNHIASLTAGVLAYTQAYGHHRMDLSSWTRRAIQLWHWGLHWFFWTIINVALCKLIDFFLDILELEILEWIYAIATIHLIMTTHHRIRHRNQSHFQSLTSLSSPCQELQGIIREFFASSQASQRIFGHDCGPRCLNECQHAARLSSIPFRII